MLLKWPIDMLTCIQVFVKLSFSYSDVTYKTDAAVRIVLFLCVLTERKLAVEVHITELISKQ